MSLKTDAKAIFHEYVAKKVFHKALLQIFIVIAKAVKKYDLLRDADWDDKAWDVVIRSAENEKSIL